MAVFHDQEDKSQTGVKNHLIRKFLWLKGRRCLFSEQKQVILGGISVVLCPSKFRGLYRHMHSNLSSTIIVQKV